MHTKNYAGAESVKKYGPGTLSRLVRDPFRWSVERYHRLISAGILSEDDRVELIQGQIFSMSPINPQHADVVDTLSNTLVVRLAGQATVRTQNPITLPNDSEPEPDIALVEAGRRRYRDRHPQRQDIYLLIEVADSSSKSDRENKLPVYADAGIPEVWIVDLPNRKITAYLGPRDGDYRDQTDHVSGIVTAQKLSQAWIEVAELF